MDQTLKRIISVIVNMANPERIILFGSRARRRQKRGSDYDILILVKYSKNIRAVEKNIYLALTQHRIGTAVDILVENEDHYYRSKGNPYLVYSQIDKFGKTVYERKTALQKMA